LAATSPDTPLPTTAGTTAATAAALRADLQALKPERTWDAAELEALYAAGHEALLAHNLPQAQTVFSLLVLQDPTQVRFLSGLGHVASLQGDFALANCLHSLAANLQPDNLRLLLPWGEALIGLGQAQPARLLLLGLSLAGADEADLQPTVQRAQALLALLEHD
jgi:predicted Zn-dependent protease